MAGITPRKAVKVPFAQVKEEFLAITRGKSTPSHYRTALNVFEKFIATQRINLISQIAFLLVDDFKSALLVGELVGRLHTFRHSFIRHVLTKGTPDAIVRSCVGHVDAAIIRDYTHVANQISTAHLNHLFDIRS